MYASILLMNMNYKLGCALLILCLTGLCLSCESNKDCIDSCVNNYHQQCVNKECQCPNHTCSATSDCPTGNKSGCPPDQAKCISGKCQCDALVCLNCPDIAHPRFCEHVETCGSNETCGMEQRRNVFGEVTFSLGCMTEQACSNLADNTTTTCRTCCYGEMCNSEGCGEKGDNTEVNICYHCTGTLDNEECHKIEFCQTTELCFIKEEFRNTEKYYQTGCMDKSMCNANTQAIFGKRANSKLQCCSGNLCNTKSQSVTTGGPTIQTTQSELQTTQMTLSTMSHVDVTPGGNCSRNAAEVESTVNCNFDDDICGYEQDTVDKLDWSRHTGMTSSLNTGPTADHTTSSGYYMYLETSLAMRKGDNAKLNSPAFDGTKGQCLTFWYNMFGVGIGTLNVYIDDGTTVGQPLWSLSGNRNNTWYQGAVPLKSSGNFKVVFEALAGDGYTGDIAIDDVKLMNECPCVQKVDNSFTTKTSTIGTTRFTTTTKSTTLPIFKTTLATASSTSTAVAPVSTPATAFPSLINCDFEKEEICGYKQESNETHDWIRHTGRTNSLNTGPTADHTLNTPNGHYMYLETSNSLHPGEKARLWTPPFTPHQGQCLSFWYHMYGVTVGTLNVYSGNNTTGTEQLTKLASISGNQGTSWLRKCISFTDASEIKIVFEAVTGNGYTGDIAIDDVQLNQPCPCTGN